MLIVMIFRLSIDFCSERFGAHDFVSRDAYHREKFNSSAISISTL